MADPAGVYLPVEVAQRVLDYLTKRPYDEVVDLVAAFHTSKKLMAREPK
jgi:hypothetical protein